MSWRVGFDIADGAADKQYRRQQSARVPDWEERCGVPRTGKS